ncbi:hypothetical protein ABZT03_24570 [Streptomyces sp. NPDC005574]|uniref:hypothetical protein n=1 Tax=Streptomyces sp. NPDC005574 TaxID=3156891 RepID=UPI0033A37710
MPVHHPSDSFEARLTDALHRTGGSFDTDRPALVTAGAVRGRRLAHRRRAAFVGGAAGVALAGVGGALLVPWGGGRPGAPDSVGGASPSARSSTPAAAVTGQELIDTLKGLLPEGKVTDTQARGTETGQGYVSAVFDDGRGKAALSVGLDRVEPGSEQAGQWGTCPDKALVPQDGCERRVLSDGSVLVILKGYEYPDRRVDTKRWSADLVTPAGQHVSVNEWNAAAEKDAAVSRPFPPLDADRLERLAAAAAWRRAVDTIPRTPAAPTAGADGQDAVSGARVLATLVALLPENVKVVSRHGEGDYAYVVVDDGKGRSFVQVNAQRNMGDEAGDLFAGAEKLADGTLVAEHQGPGDKGVEGGVMWTVDSLRPDGFRIVVSAFNAGTQHEAPTRAKPALTMKQLRAVALGDRWLVLS